MIPYSTLIIRQQRRSRIKSHVCLFFSQAYITQVFYATIQTTSTHHWATSNPQKSISAGFTAKISQSPKKRTRQFVCVHVAPPYRVSSQQAPCSFTATIEVRAYTATAQRATKQGQSNNRKSATAFLKWLHSFDMAVRHIWNIPTALSHRKELSFCTYNC